MPTVREAYYEAVQANTIPNSEESYRIFAMGYSAAVQTAKSLAGLATTPLADGPVVVLDMGCFEMGHVPASRPNLYVEVYQTEPQEPPALRHKDWKPDPIITTLEITDGARDYECDELIIHESPDGSMEFQVRSRSEDHYQTIELPPEYVEIVAAFLLRDCAPAAYLMRQDQRGRIKLRHDRVWKGVESATAAAVRETSANRLMTPVPVYEMPLLALGLVQPGFKAGNPPISSRPVAHGTPVSPDGALYTPESYGSVPEVWRSPDGQTALRRVDPGPYGTTPGDQPAGRGAVRTTVLDADPLERLASMNGPWNRDEIAAMGDVERGAAVHAKLEQIVASMSEEDQTAFLMGDFDDIELSPEQAKWITEMNEIMASLPWMEVSK